MKALIAWNILLTVFIIINFILTDNLGNAVINYTERITETLEEIVDEVQVNRDRINELIDAVNCIPPILIR